MFKNGVFELSDLRMHKLDATNISSLADGSPVPYVTGPHSTQYDFTWEASEAPNHMHNFTLEWSKTEPRFRL